MSFTRKKINVTFKLQNGTFVETSSDTAKVTGLRISFRMSQAGGITRDTVGVQIFGLTQSIMNQLATYGMPPNEQFNNHVTVEAGDDATGMSLVFSGSIFQADADYSGAPDVAFNVVAFALQYEAVASVAPISYTGNTSVATIMGNIATQLNIGLENTGVTASLSNPYFSGSLWDQAKACAKAANINAYYDSQNAVLAIWPVNQSRQGNIFVVSPQTGLVGYPTFTVNGIRFRCEWSPSIVYGVKLQMQSSLRKASGVFVPVSIDTALDSESPGGAWFMDIEAWQPGFVAGS